MAIRIRSKLNEANDYLINTYDSSKGAFVLSHVKKITVSYDGTKTYLTID